MAERDDPTLSVSVFGGAERVDVADTTSPTSVLSVFRDRTRALPLRGRVLEAAISTTMPVDETDHAGEDAEPDAPIAETGRRLLDQSPLGRLYGFVTSRGNVCVVTEDGAGFCVSDLSGGIALSAASVASAKSADTHVYGIVADGVAHVELTLTSGETVRAQTRWNSFAVAIPEVADTIRSIRLRWSDGRVTEVSLG